MTQSVSDTKLRTLVGRTVRLIVTSLALVWTASAAAEVRLENSVKKVETYVSDTGDVERRLVGADSVVPGDELRYTITFTNVGTEVVDAGSIVITNPIPENTEYVEGSAFGSGTVIVYSVDGESFAPAETLRVQEGGVEVSASAKDYTAIRWTFQPELGPGGTGDVSFNVRLK